ncbi:MAG: riboflavin biosynthesis protein RibF [Defluviitaleaceae bacterium]|nr:riboflavin biosynthesis protein RibF [Defluviitaleaceae bacterium]
MILLKGENIKMPQPCVLAMGKFESIHLGHRALINDIVTLAKLEGLASALMAFEPHPYRILSNPGYKPLYTSLERACLVGGLGVDYLLEYPFSTELAALSPLKFSTILFEKLNAKAIVVGDGYRFGCNRSGTINNLREVASKYNAHVYVIHPQKSDETEKTSTSTIRTLLSEGKFCKANALLGKPFFVMGETAKGRQLGRTIGFPTLNIYPGDEKYLPADGVYATNVTIESDAGVLVHKGITNIGFRPTVAAKGEARSVETHLLDYTGGKGDMYGRQIEVEFLRFIRPEMKFESLEALKAQISRDCEQALVYSV